MKIIALAFALYLALGVSEFGATAPRVRCEFGRVQGFVSIRADPAYLVGTIPSRFTSDQRFFSRRYNCNRRTAFVRRVDLGFYDIHFPGLAGKSAFVSATSSEAVSTSVIPLGDGVYRVALRGPLLADGVLLRRDVPFSLTVF